MLRLPGSEGSVLTLARACADVWPYEPKYIAAIHHPSRTYVLDSDYLEVPDIRPRTIAVSLKAVRKVAETVLRGKKVQHFEVQVVSVRRDGTHTDCVGDNTCEVCNWLEYSPMGEGYLIGWQAVLKERGE